MTSPVLRGEAGTPSCRASIARRLLSHGLWSAQIELVCDLFNGYRIVVGVVGQEGLEIDFLIVVEQAIVQVVFGFLGHQIGIPCFFLAPIYEPCSMSPRVPRIPVP